MNQDPSDTTLPVRTRVSIIQETLPAAPITLPSFDIALSPPDLTPWRAGNAGIDGVQHFESPRPGPHVVLTALMHGNEFSGAIALDRILRARIRPTSGRLSLIFLNLAAFDKFDPSNPTASRCIDEDMNRLWSPELLSSNHASHELDRAREVLPVIKTADWLLDLHTMLWPGDPLILAGKGPKGLEIAASLGQPHMIVRDCGHGNGARLIDWSRFSQPDSEARACILEAGQHWSEASVTLAHQTCMQLLSRTGLIKSSPRASNATTAPYARVTDTIAAQTSRFTYERSFRSGEIIAQRGTLIARDGEDEIRTPYADCVLVIPNLRPLRGHTALRLARMEQLPHDNAQTR